MAYPKVPDFAALTGRIALASQLQHEYGSKGIGPVLKDAEKALKAAVKKIESLPVDKALARREPDALPAIRALRPNGPRRLWAGLDRATYAERLEGALGRMAGCTLGAIVEGWPVARMEEWAKQIGDPFPPIDYWSRAERPLATRYNMSACQEYTRGGMNGVPVDDDTIYTLLGLLVLEDFGPDFTIDDVGTAWLKYLPMACTAEKVALDNLRAGMPGTKAAVKDNPFVQWIGADIRSDPWGYLAPGCPEIAAEMAYRDAFVSHRRNGIYGEMFFSAVIAAAFAVDNAVDAVKIGLTEIPKECALAKDVRWALRVGKGLRNYKDARAAVDARFAGMSSVHTNNNACLTLFGVMIGGDDLTRVIGETVAMGLDNDCTAATAGSICGALVGKSRLPKHWYRNFGNTIHSYLIGRRKFAISSLVRRFTKQAARVVQAGA